MYTLPKNDFDCIFLGTNKNILSYTEILSELDMIVRKIVLESLGLEKYMDEHMNSTNYVLRVQKYDRPQSHEPQPGLLPHTDKNIITILQQLNHVRGLEVLTKDGLKWITVEPTSLSSFIVVAGISFHVSCTSKVLNFLLLVFSDLSIGYVTHVNLFYA